MAAKTSEGLADSSLLLESERFSIGSIGHLSWVSGVVVQPNEAVKKFASQTHNFGGAPGADRVS